jgi:stringent starvation protein B
MEALATGRMVGVALTPATPGVVIPDQLMGQEAVVLDFGRRAPTPIEDLLCDAGGISGTLRFGGEYFWCSVPWAAVVAIAPHGPTPAQRAWNPTVIDGGKN